MGEIFLGLEILGTITAQTNPPEKVLQMLGKFLFHALQRYPAQRLHKVVIHMETSKKVEQQKILLEAIRHEFEWEAQRKESNLLTDEGERVLMGNRHPTTQNRHNNPSKGILRDLNPKGSIQTLIPKEGENSKFPQWDPHLEEKSDSEDGGEQTNMEAIQEEQNTQLKLQLQH